MKGPPLPRYNSIGMAEHEAMASVAGWPLSDYLGGELRGGNRVRSLEDAWAERLGVKHAIACNSATSGLLAAAHAIGLSAGERFAVSPLTMSATAAAPAMTGAMPLFWDVWPDTYCLNAGTMIEPTTAVFLTHLFGLAYNEVAWKDWCHRNGCKLIVDAAQAPFAPHNGLMAGTAADIGVYSLNVHKHLQAGEGGVCVTNDAELADAMRYFINHGELAHREQLGLNLRMTEVTAAIALVQLRRADDLIHSRIEQAQRLLEAIDEIPGLVPQRVPVGCRHVYYVLAFRYDGNDGRNAFVRALQGEGVPLASGYQPINRLPAFRDQAHVCPVAEAMHDHSLFYFENCRYSPTREQIKQIGDAFKKVAEHADRRASNRA